MLIECAECRAVVDARERGAFEFFDPEIGTTERALLLQCPRCEQPMLGLSYGMTKYADPDDDEPVGMRWTSADRLWPPPMEELNWSVPGSLRAAFSEAQVCYKANAYTAAAVMCRKTIEGVCKEQGIKGRNLAEMLRKLRDRHLIDGRLYEWSEALRVIGNEAAHGVELVLAQQDAADVLAFTEAIIDYLFVFRRRFDEFKERTTKRAED
jgi:hypothetical protein